MWVVSVGHDTASKSSDGNGKREKKERGKDKPCIRTGLKEQGNITTGCVQSGHRDDESDQTSQDWACDVPEFLACAIRMPCIGERHKTGENPRRGAQKQGGNIAISQSRSKCRLRAISSVQKAYRSAKTRCQTYEESIEGQANDKCSQCKHHQPNFEILHCHDQAVRDSLVLGVGICLAHILEHT